jgi:hypothetical protein
MLKDAAKLLAPAVSDTIRALDLTDKDAAAIKLAQRYADLIDASLDKDAADRAWALRWIGPLLMDALAELGATPAARARVKKPGPAADAPKTNLARLRAARG